MYSNIQPRRKYVLTRFATDLSLQKGHMLDRHFNNFRFLDPPSAFLQVFGRNQSRKISQTVIHTISSSFLDDSMRHWILKLQITTINLITKQETIFLIIGIIILQQKGNMQASTHKFPLPRTQFSSPYMYMSSKKIA